ncbi:MAG: hypothetical protein JSV66_02460 [Trueperaceae bacterium]|nr:MAG: hypothetical protein JSV66_02460 [Trueperaceae bacterium]
MRTTLTLDNDVSIMLKKLQEEQGLSFKEAVNQALRQGLYQLQAPSRQKPYEGRAFSMGKCHLNLDKIAEVLAVIEGEDYR